MATKFYLSSTGAAEISTPGFAAWTRTTEGLRRAMHPVKDATAATSVTIWANGTAAANESALARQFISKPLKSGIAFVTTDTFSGQVRCMESGTNDNINRQPICIKVYNEAGTVLQSTLKVLGHYGPNTTEWISGTLTNKTIANAVVLGANYTTAARDRLVIEIGGQVSSLGGSTVTGTQSFGSDNATDLTANQETDTTAFNPWVSFSRSVAWYEDADGSVTITGTLTGVSGSISAAPGSTVITGTLTGAGAARFLGVGEVTGTGTFTGLAATVLPTVGADVGTGTFTGLAATVLPTVGADVGTGTFTGLAATVLPTVGADVGTGTFTGLAATVLPTVGADDGTGTFTGLAATVLPTVGADIGTGTFTGLAATVLPTVGADVGAGTFTGLAATVLPTVGSTEVTSAFDGQGEAVAGGHGSTIIEADGNISGNLALIGNSEAVLARGATPGAANQHKKWSYVFRRPSLEQKKNEADSISEIESVVILANQAPVKQLVTLPLSKNVLAYLTAVPATPYQVAELNLQKVLEIENQRAIVLLLLVA